MSRGPPDFPAKCIEALIAHSFFEFAFPNNNHVPSLTTELFCVLLISFHVTKYFRPPIVLIRRRPNESRAVMLMPKAAVDKNNCLVFWKDYVRAARQLLHIFSVSKSF